MRSIRIAGLCLVALAAMAMATAATASAVPVFEINGAEVKGTEKVMASGTLTLADTKTLAGKSEVECSGTTAGTIGPGKYDRVESIHIASCKPIKVCSNVETVIPKNLPWQTELTEKSGKVRDTIKEVSGEPGWSVTCDTALGSKTDECLTEAGKEGSTTATNEVTHGYILGEFGPTSKAKCTEGGKESGEVGGIITTLSEPTGSPIRVS
jgi:hypothetical protein